MVYDNGKVTFYLDGKSVGEDWVGGDAPVSMERNLLVGEDSKHSYEQQFRGNMDDILVLGRALSAAEIKTLSQQGAEAFFKFLGHPHVPMARRGDALEHVDVPERAGHQDPRRPATARLRLPSPPFGLRRDKAATTWQSSPSGSLGNPARRRARWPEPGEAAEEPAGAAG